MRLFIATEAQVPAAPAISAINRKINDRIGNIEVTDYTDMLDRIGIIINCFDETWLSWGYGKERKYISFKNRYADIRLNIPFDFFIYSDKETQYELVKEIIIKSIRIIDERLNSKSANSFNGDEMIGYIEKRLV